MKAWLYLIIVLLVFNISADNHVSSDAPANADGNHPSLFFNASDVSRLRVQATSTHADIWATIRTFVDTLIGTSPPAVAPPDGDLLFYRYMGDRLIPLAFACVITEAESDCDLAKQYLLTFAAWEQWGERNERGLGHAHMLQANALAYDWLFHILSSQERDTVRASLTNWARRMYEASSQDYVDDWNNWWRKSYMQNFYWITNSALGVASLALLDDVTDATLWLNHARGQITIGRDILNNIGDGSWHEGIPYQNYMLSMSLPFMVNLRKIMGNDILPHGYFENYIDWRLYNQLSDGSFILAYGDFDDSWRNGFGPQGVMRFMASEYDSRTAEWVAQQIILGNPRRAAIWEAPWYVYEFLHFDATITAQSPGSQPQTRIFQDAEAVVWRTGWEADDLVFALKTGAFGGRYAFESFANQVAPWEAPCSTSGCQLNVGHDHNDTNTFYIFSNGEWLVGEEPGPERTATTFHNTILIDGEGQYRPPANRFWEYPEDLIDSDGVLQQVLDTPNFSYFAADATARYQHLPGVLAITRHVIFVKPQYFIIYDNLRSDRPRRYEWLAHLNGNVSAQGSSLSLETGNKQFLDIMPIVIGAQYNIHVTDDGLQRLSVSTSEPVDSVRMIHMLRPSSNRTILDVRTVDTSDEITAIQVSETDHTDYILFAFENDGDTLNAGMFETDGQLAAITLNSANEPEQIFTYGGEFITQTGDFDRILVSNLSPSETFEVVFLGKSAAVSGNIVSPVRVYAPEVEQLTVNDRPAEYSRDGNYIVLDASSQSSVASLPSNHILFDNSLKLPAGMPEDLK